MTKLITTAILFTALVFQASAQLIVSFTGGDPLSVGPGTAGFDFQVGATPLTLQTMGVWDDSGTGLTSSHLVGIWDMTPQHHLLASVLVTPQASTAINNYWYANLQAPLQLQANTLYMIGARYSDNDFDFAKGNVPTVVSASGVTVKDAYLSSGVGFEFPDLNVSGANLGFFGPNAGFTPVPEPAMLALVTGLALAAFGVYKRRYA
jgi:hypothetical protein